jgi:hypothetical protein
MIKGRKTELKFREFERNDQLSTLGRVKKLRRLSPVCIDKNQNSYNIYS